MDNESTVPSINRDNEFYENNKKKKLDSNEISDQLQRKIKENQDPENRIVTTNKFLDKIDEHS